MASGEPTWRDEVAALPKFGPAEFDLSGGEIALVVIDMQYVDAHRDYGVGLALARDYPELWSYYFGRVEELVIPNVQRLLAAFRAQSRRVIHFRLGAELPDGADMVKLRRPDHAPGLAPVLHHAGTFEHGILPEVAPVEGELVLNKTSRGAFNSTAIERVLRNLEVETLVVAGVTSSACIDVTARDAADRGFQVALVEDACADFDPKSHEVTMRAFAHRWGKVWSCEETLELLPPR